MKLCRSIQNRVIAGVCGGLAESYGLSPTRTRVVWVVATICTAFAGVIVYLALWYLLPKAALPFEPDVEQPWRRGA